MSAALLHRLRSMDGAELRFRASTTLRARFHHVRARLRPEQWRREDLRLAPIPALSRARRHLRERDWAAAHAEIARHFATREARFSLDPRRLPELASRLRGTFGVEDARSRADRILDGRYDLLGYRDLRAGRVPDWHLDPVHQRRAPLVFWDRVPYLDPACGDHKVTWEINRHQHFLALGRAWALTGDRRYYERFVDHLEDWILANPPLMGTNWASMLELAFRSLSWIWALHFFAAAASKADRHPWTIDLLLALERQLLHIEQNLSRYFSPNTHLTGEALALYVGGAALPELPDAARRQSAARDVLLEEIRRQVLPDGCHAERSVHYHRYTTDFYLLAAVVARVTADPAAGPFTTASHRLATFLRAVGSAGGDVPLIGDDDGGSLFPICGRRPANVEDTLAVAALVTGDDTLHTGPFPEEAAWMCGSLPDASPARAPRQHAEGGFSFPDAGYYVSRDRAGNSLIMDAGLHGYLNGGHAHADALSVVTSIGGRPFLIDPGTATYTMDLAVRNHFRSSAMHNTVVVNGRSQSEPRGPFHWNSRTDARCAAWHSTGAADYLEACHDGYAPVRHVRVVFALRRIGWLIVDHLVGSAMAADAIAYWHVHPGWTSLEQSGGTLVFRQDGGEAAICGSRPVTPTDDAELAVFAPEYGRVEPALCFESRGGAMAPTSFATFISCDAAWHPFVVRPEASDGPGAPGRQTASFVVETPSGSILATSAVAVDGHHPGSALLVVRRPESVTELCRIGNPVASSVHFPEHQ